MIKLLSVLMVAMLMVGCGEVAKQQALQNEAKDVSPKRTSNVGNATKNPLIEETEKLSDKGVMSIPPESLRNEEDQETFKEMIERDAPVEERRKFLQKAPLKHEDFGGISTDAYSAVFRVALSVLKNHPEFLDMPPEKMTEVREGLMDELMMKFQGKWFSPLEEGEKGTDRPGKKLAMRVARETEEGQNSEESDSDRGDTNEVGEGDAVEDQTTRDETKKQALQNEAKDVSPKRTSNVGNATENLLIDMTDKLSDERVMSIPSWGLRNEEDQETFKEMIERDAPVEERRKFLQKAPLKDEAFNEISADIYSKVFSIIDSEIGNNEGFLDLSVEERKKEAETIMDKIMMDFQGKLFSPLEEGEEGSDNPGEEISNALGESLRRSKGRPEEDKRGPSSDVGKGDAVEDQTTRDETNEVSDE